MRWSVIACLFFFCAALPAEYLSTTLLRKDQTLTLNGIGTVRQLNLDLYHVALYVSQTGKTPEALFDARQRRVLHLRVTADRMFATGTARHFRELMHVNNSRDDLQREAENLAQFYSVFQHGLAQGDEIIFDNSDGSSTLIMINGSEILRIRSPLFFNMLLRCYLGPRPPGLQLKNELLSTDGINVAARLSELNALIVQESREKVYQSVRIAKATPAPTPEPEPVRNEPPQSTAVRSEPAQTETARADVAKAETARNETRAESETKKPAASKPAPQQTTIIDKPKPTPPTDKPTTAITKEPAAETLAKAEPAKPKLSDTDVAELLADYQLALQAQLQKALQYPHRELKRKYGLTQLARVKGHVILKLNLDRSGDINAIWYIEKSPEKILDETAMNLVDSQAPFPALPEKLPEQAYEFFIELKFNPD